MFNRSLTPFSSMTTKSVLRRVRTWVDAAHTVGDGLDFGGRADGLIGCHAPLRVDKVGREDGVNQGGFSETSLT